MKCFSVSKLYYAIGLSLLSAIFFFSQTNHVNAYFVGGAFPNDAKRVNLDVHTGTSGTLLASSATIVRTILYSELSCDMESDNHIRAGTSGSDYLIDSEGNKLVEVFNWENIATGTTIQWLKSVSGDHCNFSIIYTDYKLSEAQATVNINNWTTSTSTTATSSAGTMGNDIDKIYSIATTTAPGVVQTVWNIPGALYAFIFSIVILVFALIIFFKVMKK